MKIHRIIERSGKYESISYKGQDRDKEIGILFKIPKNNTVRIPSIEISNVFIPFVKVGDGELIVDRVILRDYGGDGSNLRSSNFICGSLITRNNTPTRPYTTCIRKGNESIRSCLQRHGESVYDPSLLSFITHPLYPGKEVIAGYHVDAVSQLYAVKENGYTLDPNGIIENIFIDTIDAEVSGSKSQAIAGTEQNRYSNIHLGVTKYRILLDGYKYHAMFNQLDNSVIGGSDVQVTPGTEIRIDARKSTEYQSFNNTITGFEPSSKTGVKHSMSTLEEVNRIKDMQRKLGILGLYAGKIDGDHGPKTDYAMSEFMSNHGWEINFEEVLNQVINDFKLPDYNNAEELADAVQVVCKQMYREHVNYPAYMMCTVQHETANQFVPLEEGDHLTSIPARERHRQGLRYKPWWARGLVGITHWYNYEKYGELLNLPLKDKPELALDKSLALFILVHGMITGFFTTRSMDMYIKGDDIDLINIRRVVNGPRKGDTMPDRADLIASYFPDWVNHYANK